MSVVVNICIYSCMHVHHEFNLLAYAALYIIILQGFRCSQIYIDYIEQKCFVFSISPLVLNKDFYSISYGLNIEILFLLHFLSIHLTVTMCINRMCDHPKAVKWIQCSRCRGWYHCVCAKTTRKKAQSKNFIYICDKCH